MRRPRFHRTGFRMIATDSRPWSAGRTTPGPTSPTCCTSTMSAGPQRVGTPGIWNPLPFFDTVRRDDQLGNIQPLSRFSVAVHRGTLPAVSWIVPNGEFSEHPPALISYGQYHVTRLINAIMKSPDWKSTVIFVSWDDWGG